MINITVSEVKKRYISEVKTFDISLLLLVMLMVAAAVAIGCLLLVTLSYKKMIIKEAALDSSLRVAGKRKK